MVVRVRQHVNPLSDKYQTPTPPPDWQNIYASLDRPLHLDIGCARGQFVWEMAAQYPDWNFLGLEIRQPLVDRANEICQELGLTNVHFLFCNANNSVEPILASLPTGAFQRVSIQFPDPWFKKRHQKRRVVQPELVAVLAKYLPAEGVVFLQSDVLAVAQEMVDRFAESPSFQRQGHEWLPENPLGVATEREKLTLGRRDPVYRAIFTRS